jgi:aerobic carbon-monoxide dehydrogenase medium subunit
MKPAAFDYERPTTVAETLAALARHGDEAKLLAGGQSLIPMMNLRLVQFGTIIDIGRLTELRGISMVENELRIGALTTHNSILTSDIVAKKIPLLVEAYHDVAHHSVRNRGTLGGSLCHNDPASEMPLIMSVLGARLLARSEKGSREIAIEDFIGTAFTTALEPDELLTEIRIPIPLAGHACAFSEVSQRKGDYALVACAALFNLAAGKCRNVRVGYRNIGLETVRVADVEAVIEGQALTDDIISKAAETAKSIGQPGSDVHASIEYRREMTGVLTKRVLERAAATAKLS